MLLGDMTPLYVENLLAQEKELQNMIAKFEKQTEENIRSINEQKRKVELEGQARLAGKHLLFEFPS